MKSAPPSQFVAVYHPFVRTLHWAMALFIFLALGLGVWAAQLPRGELRSDVLFVHKSFGVAVLALIVVRIVARLALGAPPYAAPLGRLVDLAAKAGHVALYGLMVALPLSGYVISSASGRDVSFFGLFALPLLAAPDKATAGQAAEAHELFAWAIGIVLALHLAAVVWHARVKRDTVLTRMWPRFRPSV